MTDTATDSTGRKPAGALFVVATPIGNLGDITIRALATLAAAETVLCEDTRTSGKLMERFAQAIADVLMGEFGAPWVKVRVAKLAPIAGVKELGIAIERKRA